MEKKLGRWSWIFVKKKNQISRIQNIQMSPEMICKIRRMLLFVYLAHWSNSNVKLQV